jgi:hypothetical protein
MRGVDQLVFSVERNDPEAALEACVDALALGGLGRDRATLRELVATQIDAIVVLGRGRRGEESPVSLAEFDERGRVVPSLSRAGADAPWTHQTSPSFVAEMARRGVTFDPGKLAALAQG